ncbi:MAG: fructokinase [Solirubrobacteraceae bacterium]|jgi:fructokinase|nr:fructokinase [Solirubrobacteraceae bacterium]MEA2318986.1 fructokinase [Solirubrobacteraceae bacterium]
MILAVGEALMELRRATTDGAVAAPGEWAGPFPSGAPAIFASVAARLGAPVALAAAVGDDRFGHALVERLVRDGVRAGAIRTVAGRATAVAFVAYDDSGGRDFWFSVHDSAAVEVQPQAVAAIAQDADWLHVSGSTLAFGGGLAEAVEAAAEVVLGNGGRLSVDPNLRPDAHELARERTVRLVRRAHVLFPSEGELTALGVTADELVAGGALICATLGAAGALLSGAAVGPEPVAVPAPATEEVDPTGAGDTFAAAFVTALRGGATPVEAAGAACDLASRSVAVLGAMESPVGPR